MEITLNNATVKAMVKTLRAEVPGLKQSQGYEIVSKLFKQPNWDTLSALLTAEMGATQSREREWSDRYGWQQKAPVTAEPIKLYVRAYAQGDSNVASAPAYALITLSTELLELIHATQTRVLASGIEESTVNAFDVEWDGRGTDWRLGSPSMTVSESTVMFTAYPKIANFAVETIQISLRQLYALLGGTVRGTGEMDWAAGMLFSSDGLDAKGFARELYVDEVIDIEEVCIDKMAD